MMIPFSIKGQRALRAPFSPGTVESAMSRTARTRTTRSILGAWTSLLVLIYAVVPGLHVHTCDTGTHGTVDAVAVLDLPADDGHDAPDARIVAHDCDLCRLMTQSGALSPDTAIPTFLIADFSTPALGVDDHLDDEVWFDDRGRGPPARTR